MNGIYSCGTIRADKVGFPLELRNPTLRRGDTAQLQHDDLVATAWKDKKLVGIIINDNCIKFYLMINNGVSQPFRPIVSINFTRCSNLGEYWILKVSDYALKLACLQIKS